MDWWRWVVDIAQVIGAFASLVAIVIAVLARRAASDGLIRERRLTFDLEVLRDIAELTGNLSPQLAVEAQSTLRTRLLLLRGDDLPLLRAFADARPAAEAEQQLQRLAEGESGDYGVYYPDIKRRWDALSRLDGDGRERRQAEIDDAIDSRLELAAKARRRRRWWQRNRSE